MVKLSEAKLRQILLYFAMEVTATVGSDWSGVSVCSVDASYLRPRSRMAEQCEKVSLSGDEIEADEPCAQVDAPPQCWRSQPRELKKLFGG